MSFPLWTFKRTPATASVPAGRTLAEGWMEKEGGAHKRWTRRYFVLDEYGILNYYNDDKYKSTTPTGSLDCSRSFMFSHIEGLIFELTGTQSNKGDRQRSLRILAPDETSLSVWQRSFYLLRRKAELDGGVKASSASMGTCGRSGGVCMEGYLIKEGSAFKSWKRRYFKLLPDGALSYYEDESLKVKKGEMNVSQAMLTTRADLGDLYFQVTSHILESDTSDYSETRTLKLLAPNEDIKAQWIDAIIKVADLSTKLSGTVSALSSMGATVTITADHPPEREERSTSAVCMNQSQPGQSEVEHADAASSILMKGYLSKEGSKVKNWKRRHFALYRNGDLRYFEDDSMVKQLGSLSVVYAMISELPDHGPLYFEIISFGVHPGNDAMREDRRLLVCADDEEQKIMWTSVISELSALSEELVQTFNPLIIGDESTTSAPP